MIILCMEKNKKLDIKCVKQLWLNYISTKVDKEPASTPCSGHVLGLQKNNVKLMSSDRHTCKWFTVAKARTSNTKNPYAIDKNQSVRQLYFPNVFLSIQKRRRDYTGHLTPHIIFLTVDRYVFFYGLQHIKIAVSIDIFQETSRKHFEIQPINLVFLVVPAFFVRYFYRPIDLTTAKTARWNATNVILTKQIKMNIKVNPTDSGRRHSQSKR